MGNLEVRGPVEAPSYADAPPYIDDELLSTLICWRTIPLNPVIVAVGPSVGESAGTVAVGFCESGERKPGLGGTERGLSANLIRFAGC